MKLLLENVIMIIIDKVLLKFYDTINNEYFVLKENLKSVMKKKIFFFF